MTASRESIAIALLALFRATPGGFITIGRRHIMPPALTPPQQPALFVTFTSEDVRQALPTTPGRATLEATLIVYCQGPGTDEAPGSETALAETTLNGLLADIEAALAPDSDGDAQTLGGLVSRCWIEGTLYKDPGILANQAMAMVPVRMLVP